MTKLANFLNSCADDFLQGRPITYLPDNLCPAPWTLYYGPIRIATPRILN